METTTLSVFRVMGLSGEIRAEQGMDDVCALWQAWRECAWRDEIQAFSRSEYCVYHDYQPDGSCRALLGYLVANDVMLPASASELWIPPQQYAVLACDGVPENTLALWRDATVAAPDVRAWRMDFVSHSRFGSPKLYIGLQAAAEPAHETYFED